MEIVEALKKSGVGSYSRLVVLVSGGKDSMVLFHLLCGAKKQISFDLSVLHFNFHLRGEESDRDESFVRGEAEKALVPCVVIDTPLEKGSGIQEKARKIRLDYLLQSGDRWSHAALAHQADDQAETVLMRLLRGTGLRGLCGMEPERILASGLKLIRPLLTYSRKEITRFAEKENISFVEDSSNQTDDYLRNRIRHHLMPVLKEAHPDFVLWMGDRCEKAAREFDTYRRMAKDVIQQASGGFSIDAYFGHPSEVRFLVIEEMLVRAGYTKQVESRHFDEIETLLRRKKDFSRSYGQALLVVEGNHFRFLPDRQSVVDLEWKMTIREPGSYDVGPLGSQLVIQKTGFDRTRARSHEHSSLYLSADAVQFPLTVRFPKPGDRFSPFGLNGSKKLSDFFTDKKIPRTNRRHALVLTQNEAIVCVAGHEVDNRFRLPQTSAPSLVVRIKNLPD